MIKLEKMTDLNFASNIQYLTENGGATNNIEK